MVSQGPGPTLSPDPAQTPPRQTETFTIALLTGLRSRKGPTVMFGFFLFQFWEPL
jgi:hypothetical protein